MYKTDTSKQFETWERRSLILNLYMTKYGNATVIGDVNMTTADNHLETADAQPYNQHASSQIIQDVDLKCWPSDNKYV